MSTNHGKKLIWVCFLFVDVELHKTSRIEILRNLGKLGYDVTLLAAYSNTKPSDETLGVPSILIPVRKIPGLSYLFLAFVMVLCLPILILRLRPTVIIVEPDLGMFLSLFSVRMMPRRIRPTMVVDVRSTPVEVEGVRGKLETLSFRITMQIARTMLDGITTITTMMREDICRKFGVEPGFIGVWTSGVNADVFSPGTSTANRVRAELGVNDRFVVFYHGVLTANRGIAETITSLGLLDVKYQDIVFVVLGKGPALSTLRELSHKVNAEQRVIFHGPVEYSKVPEFIAACDVGIVPLPDLADWKSQCPLNLLECLAMSKVVVATDIPANREVTGDSRAVIYAASADPKEIAKAMMFAFDNRHMLVEWGAAGRTIVEERYDWKRIAHNFDQYLSSRR
ncbi:MAG: glycosyltransferase [Candidatus Bathyarchaeia archaeon]|jgi:glycosyltransferase involved in cell wall biosynthesis